MVTQQILVLFFLVRVRVAQQIKSILEKIQDAFFFYIFFRYVFGAQDKNGSVEISWGLFFILVKYCLLRIMKNDYLNMLASLVLPAQILDYFLISGVEQTSQEIHISLDEKMNPKLSNDEHFESKGFMEAVNVTDFPIRDHKVILKIRRRRWTDLRTGKSFSIPIDLDVVAKGTRYSKEFGAFLKETYGDIPSDLPYA